MKADLLIYNAKIFTADPAQAWAEAVAIHNGRFLAIGPDKEIRKWAGKKTRQINGNGRLILPGLIDAHVHFLQYAIRQQQLALFGESDFDVVRDKIAHAVAQTKRGDWLIGWGWDENLWDGVRPHKALLDAIAPDTPIALARMDMHSWWVNSAALKIAGITAETADPPESKIERDADGDPTGLLREWNAIELISTHIPEPTEAQLADWLKTAVGDAHRYGLTGIHDQRVENEGDQSFRLWQALRRDNALKLRVHMHLAGDWIDHAVRLGLQPGFGDDWLWVGHVKAFADGTMGSRTAWMLADFSDEPGNTGVIITPPTELWQLAVSAGNGRFPISVHAIGDRAVRELLDVLGERQTADANQPPLLPHRIEHVQLIHPDDLGRLAEYGIVASMQPVHLMTDWYVADKVWGDRARYTYAFRSLLDKGTRLALGSDAPVAPLNPFLGFYAALTRKGFEGQPADGWYPQEKITLEEIIHGYTTGPAFVAGKTAVQGSITPGKWADLVMMGQDLFTIDPEAIKEATVAMTIVGGEIVYQE